MDSRDSLHSCDLAREVVIALPADTHLHAHEVWACLLGLSHLDMGQLGLLRLPSIHHHLRMPSNQRSLESVLWRSLHKQKHGADRFWCGQRALGSVESTSPRLGNVALANGAEEKSWRYCRFRYRSTVRAPYTFASAFTIRWDYQD